MSAEPARRLTPRHPAGRAERLGPTRAVSAPDAARIERRRRMRHLQRRRRDLLEDVAMAIVLMAVVLIATAGLGVVAIISVPVAVALIGSVLTERAIKKRRREASRGVRQPSRELRGGGAPRGARRPRPAGGDLPGD